MSFPRYPSYKDSGVEWLGEVPNHWQTMQFKRLASIQNGKDYKHIETNGNDGYPVIGSGGEFARATEYLFTGESVLLGRKGTIDKPLYINGSFWVVDTMFYTVVNNKVVPKYLYYCTLTIRFDLYSTSTAVPSMTQNDLGSIYFAIPDMAEQQTIASFLDRETTKIDALIAEQQRLIELLKENRQSVISHAVTKGINPNALMKDSGIEWLGEVPEHWGIMPLKRNLAFLTSGSRGWAEHYSDDGALFIRIGNLTRDSILLDLSDIQRVIVPEGSEGERTKVQSGDVLFSITAFLGSVAVIPENLEPAFVSQHVALARLDQQHLLPTWVAYVTLSIVGKTYLETRGYGGTKIQLNLDDVANLVITVPDIKEQCTIAAFLDRETSKLDILTTEARSAISLLQERRNALISAAVTGKIDLRNANKPILNEETAYAN